VIGRHQLPASSPVAPSALLAGVWPALRRDPGQLAALRALLGHRFGARAAALTDSGTSALVLALRLAVGEGGTVAFPAYACVDLAAAARFARVRVRLYDLNPRTLSPDLDSLARALGRGARAVVIAHLYGFPADAPEVAALAAAHGATVIEDAAQSAGGTLHGTPLGGFGPLAVLSFGRGKGTTGGGGGALLAIGDAWADAVRDAAARLGPVPAGWRHLAGAAAQWAMGRPSVYGIPASIPALRLGEMVYHPAHEPGALSAAAARLVRQALAAAPAHAAARRRTATLLRAAAEGTRADVVAAIPGGAPGYLRLPVLAPAGARAAPRLGILPATRGRCSSRRSCVRRSRRGRGSTPARSRCGARC
jgi:hypothetical protein